MAKRQFEHLWTSEEGFAGRLRNVLWCDPEHLEAIRAVEGVCDLVALSDCCCSVGFDPRYDTEDVVDEIVAILKAAEESSWRKRCTS